MKLYRLLVDLRRKRNVSECIQGEKVLLIYDYVTSFEEKKDGFALLKERETLLTAPGQAEERGK
jgi:hypothetical protein